MLSLILLVVICLKIRTFVVSATTNSSSVSSCILLWFAWKFVPLWYQQQPYDEAASVTVSCDLLENSYLCGISNNSGVLRYTGEEVVICLKIRTFVVSATTLKQVTSWLKSLWFAWKFVPLWYQQQRYCQKHYLGLGCDLLENSYLCGISNNNARALDIRARVVICLKIRTFVVSATTLEEEADTEKALWFAWKFVPLWYQQQHNYYDSWWVLVVICLKIRTFVVSATTERMPPLIDIMLWFAWKFVPLWYQQQPAVSQWIDKRSCDLLENSYLCGISNNASKRKKKRKKVVICLKIRTFVVSATTFVRRATGKISCDLLENSYLCGISNNGSGR